MKVLVLGGYGLIGEAVVRRLLERGHAVAGLGRDTAAAARRWPSSTALARCRTNNNRIAACVGWVSGRFAAQPNILRDVPRCWATAKAPNPTYK